jgi:hypothetical protein
LLVGPARALVAGKTYEIWMVSTPGQIPIRTCARFTATTVQVDACGALPGTFTEVSDVTQSANSVTDWDAIITCMGVSMTFVGTSALTVMAASTYGGLVRSVAGVENPACR